MSKGDEGARSSDAIVALDRRALLHRSLAGGAALIGAALAGPAEAQSANTQQKQAAAPPVGAGDTARLVVAGNNAQGKSHIIKDERVNRLRSDVWMSDPKEPLGPGVAGEPKTVLPTTRGPTGKSDLEPEIGGTRGFFAALPPAKTPYDRAAIKGFHRTATVDYIVIMNDQVRIVFDEDDALLNAGDILILRNALHTWHNSTDVPVSIFVMEVHV
jgi:hypothetical protein